MTRITGVRTLDVRAPTSRTLAGSDAVHTDPDYSGAYVFLETDGEHEGVGMTFTIGAGNDLCDGGRGNDRSNGSCENLKSVP